MFPVAHYKQVVDIRRFSLSHYKKVMNIRRFSLPYFKKVMNIRRFSLVHYQQVVNIRRFSLSLQKVVNIQSVSLSLRGFYSLLGLIRLALGGVRAGSYKLPASHRLLRHPCKFTQVLAPHSKPSVLPVPSSPRFIKGQKRCRGASFFEKTRPSFWLFLALFFL